jgi:hypothetical protein
VNLGSIWAEIRIKTDQLQADVAKAQGLITAAEKSTEAAATKISTAADTQMAAFSAHMETVANKIKTTGQNISKIGTPLLIAGAAMTAAIGLLVKAAAEGEVAETRLATALKATGQYSEENVKSLIKLSENMADLSGISHDSIQQMMGFGLQLGFTKEQVEKLTPKILDYASATGKDLETSIRLAKAAMEGNVGALDRVGIYIEKAKDGTVDFNSVLNAFASYAGSAEAKGNTLAGQIGRLKEHYDRLAETLGTTLIPVIKDLIDKYLVPLIDKITKLPPKTLENIVKFTALAGVILLVGGTTMKLIGFVTSLTSSIILLIPQLQALGVTFNIALGTVGWLVLAVAAVALLAAHWDDVADALYRATDAQLGYEKVTPVTYPGETHLRAPVEGEPGYVPKTAAQQAKEDADAVLDAEKKAADAKVALNADLADRIYALTHTELQNKLHAIDVQAAADLDAGKDAVKVAIWVKDAKAQAEKETAAEALKITQDNATKISQVNADLDDKLYALSHSTIENQIRDLAKERDAAIAAGGSKLEAAKVYALASEKVYADARIEANQKATDLIANFESNLTEYLRDLHQREMDFAIKSIEKERDAKLKSIQKEMDAVQKQYDDAIDKINKERDARLGIIDERIAKLQEQHEKEQRSETLAGLNQAVAEAQTAEERAAAERDLNKQIAEWGYEDTLERLRKEADAVRAAAEKETGIAEETYKNDMKQKEEEVKEWQSFYDDKVTATQEFYADLMLQRNIDAEKQKWLAGKTNTEILDKLRKTEGQWAALGSEIGDAFWGNLMSGITNLKDLLKLIGELPIGGGHGGFAQGGAVYGPTLALLGETATPSNPEIVIAPGAGGGSNIEFILREVLDQMRILNARTMPDVKSGIANSISGLGGKI